MDHRTASLSVKRSPATGLFELGVPALDRALQGGLARASLHEVLADTTPAAAAIGFALALTLRVLGHNDHLIWVRQEAAIAETGGCYGPGFIQFGGEPHRLTLISLRTAIDVLRAVLSGDRDEVCRQWPPFIQWLAPTQPSSRRKVT